MAVPRRGDFVAKERIYLDAEGNVVGPKDESRNTLLIAQGGVMSAADVEKYGIRDRMLTAEEAEQQFAAEQERLRQERTAAAEAQVARQSGPGPDDPEGAYANVAPETNEDGTARSGEGEEIARDVEAAEAPTTARAEATSGDAGKTGSRSGSKR